MSKRNTSPSILGIHHLKIYVSSVQRSLQFYESVFNGKQIPELDHSTENGIIFARVLSIPAWQGRIELRLDAQTAHRTKGINVISLAVDNLDQWISHLDRLQVSHSRIIKGLAGNMVVLEDPDGYRLQLYQDDIKQIQTGKRLVLPSNDDITDEDRKWLN